MIPQPDPAWHQTDGDATVDHLCGRCGEVIPGYWRHFWRLCSCTYVPIGGGYHEADPDCPNCYGEAYLPCEPQDLRILRVSAVCRACGGHAFYLVDTRKPGALPLSARHFNAERDESHSAVVVPGALSAVLGAARDREEASRD